MNSTPPTRSTTPISVYGHATIKRYQMSRKRHTTISGLVLMSALGSPLYWTPAACEDIPISRVVGGTDASPGQYQFFASWSGSCGASLIHDDFLLTAAHCQPVSSDSVTVGAYTRGASEESDPVNSTPTTIVARIPHPDYNAASWDYDFMLLKIDTRVTHLPTVALNSDSTIPADGTDVTVLGLGRTGEENGFPTVLQQVTVAAINSATCNASPMYEGWILDSMLCAGYASGGQDACFGDSGGPLIANVNGQDVLVGTVSFGTGCARENKPGVYGRVSSAYQWIQETLCEHSEFPPSSCSGTKSIQYPLTIFEQNPPSADKFPLGPCEGDCDNDGDCDEGLFCLSRSAGDTSAVPGCVGGDSTGRDFCVWEDYRPLTNGTTSRINSVVPSAIEISAIPSDVPSASPSVAPAGTPISYLRSRIPVGAPSSFSRSRIPTNI